MSGTQTRGTAKWEPLNREEKEQTLESQDIGLRPDLGCVILSKSFTSLSLSFPNYEMCLVTGHLHSTYYVTDLVLITFFFFFLIEV